jgi:hypothetical protein
MRPLEPVLLGRTVLLGGDGMPTEARAPATITDFVRVDEVIRRFAAFGTFERHRPRHSANVQAICTGSHLNPLAELCCRVPLVQLVRLLTCEEKRPRTKQDHQPRRYYDRHKQYDHMKTLPAFNSFCGVNSSVLQLGRGSRSSSLDAYRLLAGQTKGVDFTIYWSQKTESQTLRSWTATWFQHLARGNETRTVN